MISISIIIPVYNVEQYIQRCVDSIIEQDVKGVTIECILVDDCTPDKSMNIVQKMVDNYHGDIQFKLVHHEKNGGVSAARNTGINQASGDYILFVDSDDYLLPNSLSLMAEQLNLHPAIDIIVGGVVQNGRSFFTNIQEPLLINDPNIFMQQLLCGRIYQQSWNKLVRRSILIYNNITFIERVIYEDIPWSYEVFSHCTSVLILPYDTYSYEYVETSLVHTIFRTDKAEGVIKSCIGVANKMLDNPPDMTIFNKSILVEYLLCMAVPINQGVDVLMRCPIPANTKELFLNTRQRLLKRAWQYKRLLIAAFLLLSFSPLYHLQRLRLYRHNYHKIQQTACHLSHIADRLFGNSQHKPK